MILFYHVIKAISFFLELQFLWNGNLYYIIFIYLILFAHTIYFSKAYSIFVLIQQDIRQINVITHIFYYIIYL